MMLCSACARTVRRLAPIATSTLSRTNPEYWAHTGDLSRLCPTGRPTPARRITPTMAGVIYGPPPICGPAHLCAATIQLALDTDLPVYPPRDLRAGLARWRALPADGRGYPHPDTDPDLPTCSATTPPTSSPP
jgi:hypothetical protein